MAKIYRKTSSGYRAVRRRARVPRKKKSWFKIAAIVAAVGAVVAWFAIPTFKAKVISFLPFLNKQS